MTWTRLPDDFADSPAILALSRSARLLHVEGLVYCNRHLTDGALMAAALAKVTDSTTPTEEIAELVAVGLWSKTQTGWQIDWTDQEPAERVSARKDRNARNQAAFRDRLARCRDGDHSRCKDARQCRRNDAASRDARTRGTAYVSGDVTGESLRTRPDPSRPDPKGGFGYEREVPAGGSDGSGAGAPDRRPPAKTNWRKTADDTYVVDLDWTGPE